MWLLRLLPVLLVLLPSTGFPQASYKVYTEHPRIWLDGDRLRRLRKDVERHSERWATLERVAAQGESLPEEPLVRALEYQVTGDEEAGRQAVSWAIRSSENAGLAAAADLRLAAIVFDWCQPLLDDEQRDLLAQAIGQAGAALSKQAALEPADLRSALLAVLAVGTEWEGAPRVVEALFEKHWELRVLPALKRGQIIGRSEDLVALLEMMHASRYNLEIDLFQQVPEYFQKLPLVMMLGTYPEPLRSPQGLFRQGARRTTSEVDPVVEGTYRRIAEMLLVDYENGLETYQFLQGWLRHDLFTLTTPFGAVYEFIWLNPYLPGLSYFSAPLSVHDPIGGRVFARRGWQEEDLWAGFLEGQLQLFADGQLHVIEPQDQQAPLVFPGTAFVLGQAPMKFKVDVPDGRAIYVVGLGESQTYSVKVNKFSYQIVEAGRGGILVLENSPERSRSKIDFDKPVRVQIRPAPLGAPSLAGKK